MRRIISWTPAALAASKTTRACRQAPSGRCSPRSSHPAARLPGEEAHAPPKLVLRQCDKINVVQPYAAAQRGPDAGQSAHQRRLAAAARPDHPERLARFQLEIDLAEQTGRCRERQRRPSRPSATLSGRQRHRTARCMATTVSLSRQRSAGGDHALPIADRKVDRRERRVPRPSRR